MRGGALLMRGGALLMRADALVLRADALVLRGGRAMFSWAEPPIRSNEGRRACFDDVDESDMTDFSADSLKRGSARMRGRRFLTSASPVGRLNRSGRGMYSPRENAPTRRAASAVDAASRAKRGATGLR